MTPDGLDQGPLLAAKQGFRPSNGPPVDGGRSLRRDRPSGEGPEATAMEVDIGRD